MSAPIDHMLRSKLVSQAKGNPVHVGEVRREDFLDQDMVNRNTAAIQAKIGHDKLDVLNIYAKEILMEFYEANSMTAVLGLQFVQWCVEAKLCKTFGVAVHAQKPKRIEAPFDMALVTLWREKGQARSEARSEALLQKLAAQRLAHSCGEPIMDTWRKYMPGCPCPVEPSVPGFPTHGYGPFEIPFPADRNWNRCWESGKGQLSQHVGNSVEVVEQWVGAHRKLVLRLVPDNDARKPVNEMLVLMCWADLLAWHKEMLAGKDVPFIEVLERHNIQRLTGLGQTIQEL